MFDIRYSIFDIRRSKN